MQKYVHTQNIYVSQKHNHLAHVHACVYMFMFMRARKIVIIYKILKLGRGARSAYEYNFKNLYISLRETHRFCTLYNLFGFRN